MMTNLMKDLADIGSSIGSEFKVQQMLVQSLLFILLPHCQIIYHHCYCGVCLLTHSVVVIVCLWCIILHWLMRRQWVQGVLWKQLMQYLLLIVWHILKQTAIMVIKCKNSSYYVLFNSLICWRFVKCCCYPWNDFCPVVDGAATNNLSFVRRICWNIWCIVNMHIILITKSRLVKDNRWTVVVTLCCCGVVGCSKAAAAAWQHPGRSGEDRGRFHDGTTVHQQDEVRGQVTDTALCAAGVVGYREQQEARRGWEPAVSLQTTHSTG